MFTYKVVKHEDTENGVLYALYEAATEDANPEDEAVVMGQAPVNGVFYESLDELVEHITDLYNYVASVANGDQPVLNAENVTFIDMDDEECGDCGDGCDDGCGCNDGEFTSFTEEKLGHTSDKKQCCGGNCGCHS